MPALRNWEAHHYTQNNNSITLSNPNTTHLNRFFSDLTYSKPGDIGWDILSTISNKLNPNLGVVMEALSPTLPFNAYITKYYNIENKYKSHTCHICLI